MPNSSTEKLLRQFSFASVAIGAAGYAYGFFEAQNPVVEHVSVPIANLPANLDGFKIAHLSDFHMGVTSRTVVLRAIDLVNNSGAEVVVLSGDYVDSNPSAVFALTPMLKLLTAKYGIYAGIGNHDFNRAEPWYGEIVSYGFRYYGLRLLLNEHVQLPNGLVVAGVDDPLRGTPDVDKMMAGVSAESTTLLICHRPDFADLYCQDGRFALQLSGHTHGGQVRIPGKGAIVLPTYGKKYVNGLYDVGGMWLYVNRGLGGTHTLRLRFNCRPEVTILTLLKA